MVTLYLASFVPACWLVLGKGFVGAEWVNTLYSPVLWAWEYSPQPVRHWVKVVVNDGARGRIVIVPRDGQLCYYVR